MRNIITILKRELKGYFQSPVAYVFMFVFLVLQASLTFFWPASPLFERGIADLSPFFFWIPLVFLLLVPAATMGLWAEERKAGTIELLLTMPISLTEAIMGKFIAAWIFLTINLILTFPIVITVFALGRPDVGAIICGYIGAVLLAGACVSIGMLTSATTKSQVISFVMSISVCFVLIMAGTPFITGMLSKWDMNVLVEAIGSLSLYSRYESLQRGVIDLGDVVYYLSIMAFMLFTTHMVLENRKSA